MADLQCKLLVLGAGPGGYVCAIRAGQLGIETIVVDQHPPGGTCLNVGCIPSKALIHAADEFHNIATINDSKLGIAVSQPSIDIKQTIAWKDGIVRRLNGGVDGLFKKAKVKFVQGQARFVDGKTVLVVSRGDKHTIRAENIVIATGSTPIEIPSLPFGGDIWSSTEALSLSTLPKSLAVVGGGYIGLEIGTALHKLGTQVTVVESTDSILPQYDNALTKPVKVRLKELGIKLKLNCTALSFAHGCLATDQGELDVDKVLVAVGRKPNTRSVGVDELMLSMNGPYIKINSACQTSMRGIYAIGDVTGEPMLAHRAIAQGELVAERIAGNKIEWDKLSMPAVCFTDPEIVSCGLLPHEEDEAIVAEFPFAANGRAMTTEREDGFVRVVARAEDQAVIGIQAVGHGVSELSAAFSLAIEMGATLADVAATIHAHPTQSEGFQEAALKALGNPLHI